MPTSGDVYSPTGFFSLASIGKESDHNPLEMLSSISYNVETKDIKSVKHTLTTCLEILGYRLLKIICI